MSNKPRERWLLHGKVYDEYPDDEDAYRVIEYSAYEDERAKCEALFAELKWYEENQEAILLKRNEIIKERDEARAQARAIRDSFSTVEEMGQDLEAERAKSAKLVEALDCSELHNEIDANDAQPNDFNEGATAVLKEWISTNKTALAEYHGTTITTKERMEPCDHLKADRLAEEKE